MAGYRYLAILLFGVVAPLVLLGLAVGLMWSIGGEVSAGLDPNAGVQAYGALKPVLAGPQDYTLAAYLFAEAANRQIMLTKQVMKVVVIHIGFAIASVGIMLVMLGFGSKEATAISGEANGTKFDVQMASFGALVFLAGALLSGIAGIMPNSYRGTGQPYFAFSGAASFDIESEMRAELQKNCTAAGFPNDPDCVETGLAAARKVGKL